MKQTFSYKITTDTLALIPAKSIEFNTIALEHQQCQFIKQTPLEIIQANCLENWSTYEIGRHLVTHHLGFKRKVPIPIHIKKALITFPTHAPNHYECNWIIFHHHLRVTTHHGKTILHLNDHQQLPLDISSYTINKQISRAFAVYYKLIEFTERKMFR